jgi:hypothetical protein
MSSSATRPRKKSAMKLYMDINKTNLNHEFNKRWEIVKDTMQAQDQIGAWTEFVKDRWDDEMPAVKNEIIKQVDDENKTLFREWKQKAAFAGTPEDLDKYDELQLYDLKLNKLFQGMEGVRRRSPNIC